MRTPDISRELSHIPAAAGEAIADAVDEIESYLVSFDCSSMVEYGLFGKVGTEDGNIPRLRLTVDDERKAAALLALLDATIGKEQEARAPYDLSDALYWIKTLAPSLADCPAFRRLSTTARRQG